MSHDIRTPMNAILGMSSLALDEIDKKEAVKDYLEKISSSGQYLLGLINDILDMSRIESNRVEFHLAPGTITQCLRDVLISMQAQLDQKKLQFNFVQLPDSAEHPVMLDNMRIQQIFFNLLSNAVKFTDEGGSVLVAARRDLPVNGHIVYHIDVQDSGIGIAKEAQERVFEPFEQAGPPSKNGSGLGLAIVKNLLQLMGGTIRIESRLGAGTTFHIDIPFEVSNVPSVTETKPPTADFDFGGRSVLLVEDHPINMEIARKLLERKNCRVTSAFNGQEAVDILLHGNPGEFQAVLMDVQMPVLNGLDASRQIRAAARGDLKTLPIITMSANAFEEDIRRSRDAGMNGYLTKPINPDLLYQTLQNIWGGTNEG